METAECVSCRRSLAGTNSGPRTMPIASPHVGERPQPALLIPSGGPVRLRLKKSKASPRRTTRLARAHQVGALRLKDADIAWSGPVCSVELANERIGINAV